MQYYCKFYIIKESSSPSALKHRQIYRRFPRIEACHNDVRGVENEK